MITQAVSSQVVVALSPDLFGRMDSNIPLGRRRLLLFSEIEADVFLVLPLRALKSTSGRFLKGN